MSQDPYLLANQAAHKLTEITKVSSHDVLVVLGSGWTPAADALGKTDFEINVDLLPGDRKSTRLNSSHMSESRMPSSA